MKYFGMNNRILTPYMTPYMTPYIMQMGGIGKLRIRNECTKKWKHPYTFRKQGRMPITILKHEPIKKVYVEMVRQIVESEVKNDEDAE